MINRAELASAPSDRLNLVYARKDQHRGIQVAQTGGYRVTGWVRISV
jgi:hypothetical protein